MRLTPFFFAAGLLAILPLSTHAKIVRVIEKSFAVQPGGLLTVETQGGNIQVEAWDQPTVKVTATQTLKTDSESEADELLKKLALTIEQEGSGITAKARYEKRATGFMWGSWPPVQVSFVVSVPSRYHATLKTSGGNVRVGNLGGNLDARTSGGNIELGKITGDVEAHTSGGDVRLAEGSGTVKLATSGGNISVERAKGPTELKTSGGDIRITSVENILLASTSGGNVTAGLAGALKGDCVLETSGGNVRAHVSPAAAFRLEATTSGGNAKAEGLSFVAEESRPHRSRLTGNVNGGGPLLKLRSSGGDVVVAAK